MTATYEDNFGYYDLEADLTKRVFRLRERPEQPATVLALLRAGAEQRTLSRRLAAEGTTYDELVDQLRRSLAFQFIKAQTISMSQIASLLGYEGSTSFRHAFARWTGRSPSADP
jgi:AraC-like DNA-binding protein